MRSSSGPERRRRWRARSACGALAARAAEAARARVGGGDEHEARREDHDLLAADDRHVAVLERLAQRLEARAGELRELVEEEHAAVRERRLARLRRAARRRPGRRPRSCGAARGTGARVTSPPPPRSPAIDWMRVTSIASSALSGGRIDGSRRAIIVLPVPGGPCRNRLWPPAAATSSAGDRARCGRGRRRGRAPRSPASGGSRRAAPAGAASPRSVATSSLQRLDAEDLDVRHQRRLARARHAAARAGAARGAARPRRRRARRGPARTSPVSDSSPTTAHASTRLRLQLAGGRRAARPRAADRTPGRPCAGRPARG